MKNSKKSKVAQPLSKKQRKKLEKSGATFAVKKKMSREKKWLISLIAGVCALAIACATFGGILLARALDGVFDDPTLSVYETMKMSKHLDTRGIDSDFYTGNLIDLTAVTKNDGYTPYDLSHADKYLQNARIHYSTLNKGYQRKTEIGIGDVVALYVTDFFVGEPKTPAEEKESRMEIPDYMLDLFGTYTSYTTFVVGLGTFGEDFDNKLVDMKLKPESTYRNIRSNGKIKAEDTVCMTVKIYNSTGRNADTPYADELVDRYNWEKDPISKYSQDKARIDLDDAFDERLCTALVEKCKAIGEEYTFVLEDYNLTGGSDAVSAKADYKVVATAHYVLEEEKTESITFTLPDSYFLESDEGFYDLNGKTVTMRFVVLYSDDYELPELNRDFIVNTLKADVTATDDAGAIAEYKQKTLERLNAELEAKKQEAMIGEVLAFYVKRAEMTSSFLESNANASAIANAIQVQLSRQLFEKYVSDRRAAPTSEGLEDYVATIARASQIDVSSADDYISYLYSALAGQMKKTDLIAYHIFDEEGMKITDEAVATAMEEYLARLVSKVWDSETYNREYFINMLGEDQIKSWVRRDLVYRMVGEYLIENNLTKVE